MGNVTAIITQTALHDGELRANRRRCLGVLGFADIGKRRHGSAVRKPIKKPRYWTKPGRPSLWWDDFGNGVMVADEWRDKKK